LNDKTDAPTPHEGEIVPPESKVEEMGSGGNPAMLALLGTYMDRPDLFIAEVEKHDPGFINRMSASAEGHAEQLHDSRHTFGKWQANATLSIQVLSALATIVFLGLTVVWETGFWPMIALIVFYSVSLGGWSGFQRIADGCSRP